MAELNESSPKEFEYFSIHFLLWEHFQFELALPIFLKRLMVIVWLKHSVYVGSG